MTELLRSCDTVILGVLEHLVVELLLGVVGLGVELAPKVCSGTISDQEEPVLCGVPESLDSTGPNYYLELGWML